MPQGFAQLYEPLTANRDLVLLDQRGTGLSEPSLACDEYTDVALESLGSDLSDEELEAEALDALEECHERLADDGVDFADYNSAASAADLEDLRVALDYDEWNLYGISYGTRLAQQAMRDHPDGIRSVVLDSAYPADADLYAEMPGNAERAMEALFTTCADDPACAAAYPDLGRTFRDLVAELNAAPAPITVVDGATGERVGGRPRRRRPRGLPLRLAVLDGAGAAPARGHHRRGRRRVRLDRPAAGRADAVAGLPGRRPAARRAVQRGGVVRLPGRRRRGRRRAPAGRGVLRERSELGLRHLRRVRVVGRR